MGVRDRVSAQKEVVRIIIVKECCRVMDTKRGLNIGHVYNTKWGL
jgi:hypothetical protein